MPTRLLRTLATLLVASALVAAVPAVATAARVPWLRPVHGRVVREFQAPLTRYGRAHLGVDLAAAPGTTVRASAAGTVVFAGLVAGARHVVIRHPGDLRTSYSFLASVSVRLGDKVARGAPLGTTGESEGHSGAVLHFGLRIGDAYVDPMRLFAPVDLAAIVHLAPLVGTTSDEADDTGVQPLGMPAEDRALTRAFLVPAPIVLRAGPGPAPEQPVGAGRRTASGGRLYPR